MAEWTRASEVLAPEEWDELDQLPPSRFKQARRDVAGERKARQERPDAPSGGRRLRRARRILQKQAAGEFPVPGGRLEKWTGLLSCIDEYMETARAPKAEGQSFRDWYETQREAMTRAHELVRVLLELCPTPDELMDAREARR